MSQETRKPGTIAQQNGLGFLPSWVAALDLSAGAKFATLATLSLFACRVSPVAGEAPIALAEPLSALAGECTTADVGPNAFGQVLANMSATDASAFFVGNSFFKLSWVSAPASAVATDGLGPVFNASSCSACHLLDGRGAPPDDPNASFESMLVRLSVPGQRDDGGPVPHPAYGDQLQPRGIRGVSGEGDARVRYEELPGEFADGERYVLRRPIYSFVDLQFGPLGDNVLFSPRVGNHLVGMGLLEAVDERELALLADPDDADGDGVSGRKNRGRFGWKGNQPSLLAQTKGAFLGDLGLTSDAAQAQNCSGPQLACAQAPAGGDPEVTDQVLESMMFYLRALSVPTQRNASDPVVLKGQLLFSTAGCASCHTVTLHTTPDAVLPQLANQTIHPFTDLLVHDMGDALGDGRPDFVANGNEWRTAPLWGLGLLKVVNRHDRLLHDGRARGFAEAILWHGGEAEDAKQRFVAMNKDEREALVRFLESI